MAQKMLSRNRMSLHALVEKEKANFDFIPNPKNGNLFFACGSKVGFVSAKAKAIHKTCDWSELEYAECCKPELDPSVEENWVPCIMTKGAGATPSRTLKYEG